MIQTHAFAAGPVEIFRAVRSLLGKRIPLIPVHCFLVDGLLIDTQMPHARRALTLYLQDRPLRQAVLTHHHEDHSGNAAWLQQAFGIPVFGSPMTQSILAEGVPVLPYQRVLFGKTEPAHLLKMEDMLSTEHYTFQIIPTPGHARDHQCFYVEEEGWLFSGDMYAGDWIRVFKREESISQQIRSLERLLRLDFDVLFCAHRPQLKAGKMHLQRKQDYLVSFREEVQLLHAKGLSAGEIMRQLPISEQWPMRLLSGGDVSLLNMVQSALHEM